jgi:hypothetical protein
MNDEITDASTHKPANRYVRCACCGTGFYSNKPQDPERDIGFGHCKDCHKYVAESWVKHGFPADRPITLEQALARLEKYA